MDGKKVTIKDIDETILENLEGLCLPEEKQNDPLFIEGNSLWRKWVTENLKRYDTIGKVAYVDSEIVGSILYVPKSKEKVVEIKCLYGEDGKKVEKVKEALLNRTIKEFERPKSYFGGESAEAIVAFPHPVPQDFGNAALFKNNGFEKVQDYSHIYYFSLDENYSFELDDVEIAVEEEDKNKALIISNFSCPYCVKEMVDLLNLIRDIDSEVPIKVKAPFKEPDQLTTVFSMPVCMIIKGEAIEYSKLEDKKFLKKLKKTLNKSQRTSPEEDIQ